MSPEGYMLKGNKKCVHLNKALDKYFCMCMKAKFYTEVFYWKENKTFMKTAT